MSACRIRSPLAVHIDVRPGRYIGRRRITTHPRAHAHRNPIAQRLGHARVLHDLPRERRVHVLQRVLKARGQPRAIHAAARETGLGERGQQVGAVRRQRGQLRTRARGLRLIVGRVAPELQNVLRLPRVGEVVGQKQRRAHKGQRVRRHKAAPLLAGRGERGRALGVVRAARVLHGDHAAVVRRVDVAVVGRAVIEKETGVGRAEHERTGCGRAHCVGKGVEVQQ